MLSFTPEQIKLLLRAISLEIDRIDSRAYTHLTERSQLQKLYTREEYKTIYTLIKNTTTEP